MSPETIESDVKIIIENCLAQSIRAKEGWAFKRVAPELEKCKPTTSPDSKSHTYEFMLFFRKESARLQTEVIPRQFQAIAEETAKIGSKMGWSVVKIGQNPVEIKTDTFGETRFAKVDIKKDIMPYVKHIVEREAQIGLVYAAILAAYNSNFEERDHCLLEGDPACGKTEILLSIKEWLGEEAVGTMDATAMSGPGALRFLRSPIQPRLLIIEEIEKVANETTLGFLLGVMDKRGEINVTKTGQTGKKSVPLLILATCNDTAKFKKMYEGALWSRFPNKIHCARLTDAGLRRIVYRHAKAIGAENKWAEECVQHCLRVEENNDPRRVKAVLSSYTAWERSETKPFNVKTNYLEMLKSTQLKTK